MAKIQAKSADYEAESNESETVCQPQNQTQNLLPVREWGFKSLHPHQRLASGLALRHLGLAPSGRVVRPPIGRSLWEPA